MGTMAVEKNIVIEEEAVKKIPIVRGSFFRFI